MVGLENTTNPMCGECYSKLFFLSHVERKREAAMFLDAGSVGSLILAILTIVVGVGCHLFDTSQLLSTRSLYILFDWLNKLLFYTMSIAFVVSFKGNCWCVTSWQWELGVLAMFQGWLNLIVYASKFPLIGIYVIMLARVFYTFLKVVLLASFLVIAFGLSFYMAFYDPEIKVNFVLH